MEKDKHLGLRLDSDTHRKLKSMAEFDGRSINGEVLYLIRQAKDTETNIWDTSLFFLILSFFAHLMLSH